MQKDQVRTRNYPSNRAVIRAILVRAKMTWWSSRGAKVLETGVRIPPWAFFSFGPRPRTAPRRIYGKNVLFTSFFSFKSINWAYSCHSESFTFPAKDGRVPWSSGQHSKLRNISSNILFPNAEVHMVQKQEMSAAVHFENDYLQKNTVRKNSYPISRTIFEPDFSTSFPSCKFYCIKASKCARQSTERVNQVHSGSISVTRIHSDMISDGIKFTEDRSQ